MELARIAAAWDQQMGIKEADSSSFSSLLITLTRVANVRFRGFQNDGGVPFQDRLRRWLKQFEPIDQPAAFLLAARIIFLTEEQFHCLQRRLLRCVIRKHILDGVIASRWLPEYDYGGGLDPIL